jgi:archaellum component FlaC
VGLLEKRIERIENRTDQLENRVTQVEKQLSAGDVRFQEIRRDLEDLKKGFRQLTTWIQGAAISIGLGVMAAVVTLLAAWK